MIMLKAVLVAVLYGAVSVAVNFVNKYAVLVMPLPILLLLVKTLSIFAVVGLLSACKLIHLQPHNAAALQAHVPIALVYCAHALLSLRSLLGLNIPVYNTLKRMTPVMVLGAKAYLDNKLPEPQIAASVVLVVLGCVVAGFGDLTFDSFGYTAALLCAAMQAAYIILAERTGGKDEPPVGALAADAKALISVTAAGSGPNGYSSLPATEPNTAVGDSNGAKAAAASEKTAASSGDGNAGQQQQLSQQKDPEKQQLLSQHAKPHREGQQSAWDVLYGIAAINTPILIVLLITSQDEAFKVIPMVRTLYDEFGFINFCAWVVVTALAECALTGTMLWCAQVTSAVTTSLVGVMKGVVAVVLGFFLLGGVKFHWLLVIGIAMNLSGGIWYSVIKMRAKGSGSGGGSKAVGVC